MTARSRPPRFSARTLLGVGFGLLALQGGRMILTRENAAATPHTPCTVGSVLDGDTFLCDLNQNGRHDLPEEKIRLLGIDTPETRYGLRTRKRRAAQDEPYAQAAKRYLQSRLRYKSTAYLQWDVSRGDPYGRSLAYVYPKVSAATSLNEALLSQGLARVLFYPPNTRYQARFEAAERRAQQQHLNLWAQNPPK